MPVYKDKKYNTWYCQIWYTDWQGKRKHKVKRGFARKKDAQEFEANFKIAEKEDPEITLGSLYDHYKEIKMSRLKSSTQENKDNIFQKHILPYLKDRKITEIDSKVILQWQNKVKNEGKYSETYLKSINNQMSTLFNFAVRHYNLTVNPCHIAGSMGCKKTSEEMQFWTLEEFNKFIPFVHGVGNRIAFNILYWCGLRKGELLALTPKDILDTKEINIIKTGHWTKINNKKAFLVTTPKTKKSIRKVSIPDFLYKEITDYISRLYGITDDDRIFSYESNNAINEIMKRASTAAGVKKIRVHDLRHSHASLCIEKLGVDNILLISERLGHENVETTLNIYSHLYPNKQVNLANKLNEISKK